MHGLRSKYPVKGAGPPPERAFLGTDRLTVAIPLKTEAASGQPVVAQEDFAAFNLLADLARDLQLDATAEYIPLGGELDLNRDNLIVICGPRLSPVIREVLQSDPALGFEQRRHRNHSDGFWVASTDPSAAQHALTDTVARDGLQRAAVLSDGATRLVDRFGLLDWRGFLDVLAEQGPDRIIRRVRAAEASDLEGRRWPRGKRHGDASAASCHLI